MMAAFFKSTQVSPFAFSPETPEPARHSRARHARADLPYGVRGSMDAIVVPRE